MTNEFIGRSGCYKLPAFKSVDCRSNFGYASRKNLKVMMHISLINRYLQSYESTRWQQFLIYVGLTLGAFIINAFMNSILPVIYRGACMSRLSPFGFVANMGQLLGLSVDSRLYPSQSWPVPHPTIILPSKSKTVAC